MVDGGGHLHLVGVEGDPMRRVFVAMLLPGLLLAGCGDDGGEGEGQQSARSSDVQRFCELIEQYNKGNGFVAPPKDTPPDQQTAALTQAMRDYLSLPEIQAILDELGEIAPAEVDDAVDVMRDKAARLVETGENTFEQPDGIAANEQIKAYTETACAPEGSPAPSPTDSGPGAGEQG